MAEPYNPKKLPAKVGVRFNPWGTDSVGTVIEVSKAGVTFVYDHAPEVRWSMGVGEFNDRFARVVEAKPVSLLALVAGRAASAGAEVA